jgi:hypothetical protein
MDKTVNCDFHILSFNNILGALARLGKTTIRFVMSVRGSAWINSALSGRIYVELDIGAFFENLSRKFKFSYNLTRITGTLHEDQHTFLDISRLVFPKTRNISGKCVKKLKTQILGSITPFLKNHAVYEMIWKSIVQRDRPNVTIWRKRIAWGIPRAANTLRIYNNDCFPTATMVARTRLNVTFSAHSLYIFLYLVSK